MFSDIKHTTVIVINKPDISDQELENIRDYIAKSLSEAIEKQFDEWFENLMKGSDTRATGLINKEVNSQ